MLIVLAGTIQISLSLRGGLWFESQDALWYPVRIVEYAESIKGGAWFPRWAPDLRGGYGYPLFNFYPPGFIALASHLMTAFGLTPIEALKITLTGFTIAGAVGAYGLMLGETSRPDAALVGAMAYAYLPYRFTDLYLRGELSEYSVYAILPFVMWSFRALRRANTERRATIATAAMVSSAALWLLHPLVALYSCGAILLVAVVDAMRARHDGGTVEFLAVSVAAMSLGVAAAAIYLIPALAERGYVHLENLTRNYGPTRFLIGWSELLSPGFYSLGIQTVAGAMVSIVALSLPSRRDRAFSLLLWWIPACAIVAIMLRWAGPLWRALPLGGFILFPWRLLGLAGLLTSVGIAVAWTMLLTDDRPISKWLAAVTVALAIAWFEYPYTRATWLPELEVSTDPGEIAEHTYTTVIEDEYLPKGAEKCPPWPRYSLALIDNRTSSKVQSKQIDPLHYEFQVSIASEKVVEIQLLDFPGWNVTTAAGPSEAQRLAPRRGLITLRLPTAGDYRILVGFGTTKIRALSSVLSIIALALGCPILSWIDRRRIV